MGENIYYCYLLLDPRYKGQYYYNQLTQSFLFKPFYVGKGKGKRCQTHSIDAFNPNNPNYNSKKYKTIREIITEGHQPIILKIQENLLEKDSLKIEQSTIDYIGLDNLTNAVRGGLNGHSGFKHSQEFRDKLRKANIGKKMKKESVEKMRNTLKGRKILWVDKIKESLKGKQCSIMNETTAQKIKESMIRHHQNKSKDYYKTNKSYKQYKFTSPEGIVYIEYGITQFCKKHNLSEPILRRSLIKNKILDNGRHKGWRAEYYNPID